MIKRYKTKQLSKKPFVLAAILLTVLCIAAALYLFVIRKSDTDSATRYAPPTKEEKRQAEKHKEELVEKEKDQPSDPPASAINVVITYAGQFEQTVSASAYISGTIEESGTCTLTLTKGSHTITRSKPALPDAKHTTCPAFDIPRSDIPETGTWKATISYNSITTENVSASQDIEVT